MNFKVTVEKKISLKSIRNRLLKFIYLKIFNLLKYNEIQNY
jgi:hypothetical protein